MDLQNIIIALQDQVIALEEKLTELTKLRETDIAIAHERNEMTQRQIAALQSELASTKMAAPVMPTYPMMPGLGTGTPISPWGAGMTITSATAADMETITATTTDAGDCFVLTNGTDPVFKLR